jgi:hypothetical protein
VLLIGRYIIKTFPTLTIYSKSSKYIAWLIKILDKLLVILLPKNCVGSPITLILKVILSLNY